MKKVYDGKVHPLLQPYFDTEDLEMLYESIGISEEELIEMKEEEDEKNKKEKIG